MDLSVIVPFCNETSNAIFTTQALIEELDGFCKYEIILVDNLSNDIMVARDSNLPWRPTKGMAPDELQQAMQEREYPLYGRNYFYHPKKGTPPDQFGDKNNWEQINTHFFQKGVVKYFIYDDKQGHWNAKNHGIKNSTGKYVFFLDAHCIMKRDSVRKMLTFLRENEGKSYEHPMTPGKPWRVGAVHAYIAYILDSHFLEYRPQRKTFGYQFCTHQSEEYFQNGKRLLRFPTKPYQVCVMSTCGMMCPRSVLADLGAWHPEFGIYAGGESYMNWKQSTCGYGHFIHPEAVCWHHADKRGYSWNWSDYTRNSMIAAYVVGGERFLQDQVSQRLRKSSPAHLNGLADDVRAKCQADMEFVHSRQVIDFESYIAWWEEHPGVWQ